MERLNKRVILVMFLLVFSLFLSFQFYHKKRNKREKYWMCDWDCTKENKFLLYTKIVDETKVCEKKKIISWEGIELKCKLLGSFLRSKKEIEEMCKEDYIICE